MPLILRFLGTAASRPTVERNVSAIALVRDGETLLFDCGEGTQRQMMRYGISLFPAGIFFTHFHADHVLGVIGLIRTMQLQDRTEPLRIWGPAASRNFSSKPPPSPANDSASPSSPTRSRPARRSPATDTRSSPSPPPTAEAPPSATRSPKTCDSDDSTRTSLAHAASPKAPSGAICTAAARSR